MGACRVALQSREIQETAKPEQMEENKRSGGIGSLIAKHPAETQSPKDDHTAVKQTHGTDPRNKSSICSPLSLQSSQEHTLRKAGPIRCRALGKLAVPMLQVPFISHCVQTPSEGWSQGVGGGEGGCGRWMWCRRRVHMFVDRKMRPAETVPGMGGGRSQCTPAQQ
jgi:hypothetical protein